MFYFFFLIHLFFVNCFKQIMKIMKNRNLSILFNIVEDGKIISLQITP